MNLTDLPFDIIESISLHLSNRSIQKLSRSCHAIYNHFLPKLYKNISLSGRLFQEFHTALKCRPYLGQYVKEVIDDPLGIHLLVDSL